jgi:hypothetical protein
LAQAALAGELSMTQVALVTDAVQSSPGSASFLLATARCRNVRGLEAECQRVKAHEQRDARGSATSAGDLDVHTEASSRANRHRGRLRSWVDEHGRWHLAATGSQQDGELVMSVLRRFAPATVVRPSSRGASEESLFGGLVALAEASAEDAASGEDACGIEQDFLVRRTGGRPAPKNWGRKPSSEPPPRPPFPVDGLDWLFAPVEDGT